MALQPSADAIIRGIQRSLMAHVLPETSTLYAGAQVRYAVHLLNALAAEWDGAAQRLVEDNAALRAFAARAAGPLRDQDAALAAELSAAAGERDPDVRVSTLRAANDRLRGLLTRVIAATGDGGIEPPDGLLHDMRRVLRESVQSRTAGAL